MVCSESLSINKYHFCDEKLIGIMPVLQILCKYEDPMTDYEDEAGGAENGVVSGRRRKTR